MISPAPSVGDHLLAAARTQPSRRAVACGPRQYCYAVFAERAARLAGALIASGIEPGDLVMTGYWRRPTETAALLVDGWLRTGDLATVDPWGYLRIVGRAKELIDCGGEKFASAEIERVLAAHPAVREAEAVGVPHSHWGQAPEALVVLRPGADVDTENLRRHCARHLAPFKVPRAVRIVTRLPHTPTGKLARARLA